MVPVAAPCAKSEETAAANSVSTTRNLNARRAGMLGWVIRMEFRRDGGLTHQGLSCQRVARGPCSTAPPPPRENTFFPPVAHAVHPRPRSRHGGGKETRGGRAHQGRWPLGF